MSVRAVALLWLVLAAVVWNGFFDLYVARGANEYGQLRAEYELGRGPDPDMTGVMARAQRKGARAATAWAVLVAGAGWVSIWVVRRSPRKS